MKKDSILLSIILIFLFLTMQAFYGCGPAALKKSTIPASNQVCDEKADEALRNRRHEKSIILHEFFLKEHPENALSMYHMGFSYGQMGDHENEAKYYEKAISRGFYSSNILFNLGMVYGEMGKYDDSVRIFKKAIEIEPDRADNHFGLALAYQRMTSRELAEKEFKRAIKLEPGNIDSIYFLGVHYVETGRIDEAKKQLERLMEIDPENEMAMRLEILLQENKK